MTITFESLWVEYGPIVDGVAAEYGNKGRRHGAEADDFRQEFVCWMLDKERDGWLGKKHDEIEDPDEFGRFLAQCLRHEGDDYLVDIRDQAGGQPRRGAYFYSTNELKELLPAMFDPKRWHEPPQSEGRTSKSPAEGGNWIATLADVARAYEQLDIVDKALLQAIHKDGVRNKELAKFYDITEATMSYRHTQVLKRLLKTLGGARPKHMRADVPGDPWRGRHPIPAAQMRAITASYWDGEDA